MKYSPFVTRSQTNLIIKHILSDVFFKYIHIYSHFCLREGFNKNKAFISAGTNGGPRSCVCATLHSTPHRHICVQKTSNSGHLREQTYFMSTHWQIPSRTHTARRPKPRGAFPYLNKVCIYTNMWWLLSAFNGQGLISERRVAGGKHTNINIS